MRTVRCVKAQGSLVLGATYNVVREHESGDVFISGNGLHYHGRWPADYFENVPRSEIVLLSGGLDSAVVLWSIKDRKPECLSFDYGQRHIREIDSAKEIAKEAGCHHLVIKLPPLSGSSLTGDKPLTTDAHDTVVPNRNMIMFSVAANYVGQGGHIYFGGHADDHAVYPDCRPEFLRAMSFALGLSCGVTLHSPLQSTTRQEIASLAKELGVPVEKTWSCYAGGESPCNECSACVGRRKVLSCSH